jgi:hypothetical protein
MSRTYGIPFTGRLTGLAGVFSGDKLPDALVFKQNLNALNSSPAQRRIYLPSSFDVNTGTTTRPDQVVVDLGFIDPVDLFLKSGPPNQASPDDFLATLSVQGPFGDPTGEAQITVIASDSSPRFASFVIPQPSDGFTVGRVASRYGIPILTGDTIVLDWLTVPVSGPGGIITLNLSPADGCCMQQAMAAWFAVNGQGPPTPSCDPPVINSFDSIPAPIFSGAGAPVDYTVDLDGTGFLADDIVTIESAPAGVTLLGSLFVSPVLWTTGVRVLAGTLGGNIVFRITRVGDPTCFDEISVPLVPLP